MRGRRSRPSLVLLALVLGACSGEGAPPLVFDAATTTVQSPSTTAAPTTTTATSTTATSPPRPGVEVYLPILRYDGDSGTGTIEVVVCNSKEQDSDPFSVSIVEPVPVPLAGDVGLGPQTCAGYFDASIDLIGFGIEVPGEYPILVEVSDERGATTLSFSLAVDAVTVTPDADQLLDYEACLVRGEEACANWVDYQPVPGEVLKRSGDVQAIAPLQLEQLASFSVLDQLQCVPSIERFFGLQLPRPVSHRYVVAGYSGSYAAPLGSWTTSTTLDNYFEQIDSWFDSEWATLLRERCSWVAAHELTHVIIGSGPLGGYINEGLATWMEITERSNGEYNQPNVVCHEDAWYGYDLAAEAEGFVPYSNLSATDQSLPGIYHYYTGLCFWDYLEKTYGTEAVVAIVQASRSYHDIDTYNGCTPGFTPPVLLIRDVVNPIVGDDVSPVTDQRWGVGLNWTQCDDL